MTAKSEHSCVIDFGIVYHVFNTVNGKAYVGQTWRGMSRRWIEHKNLARKISEGSITSADPFVSALAKYGHENFDRTTLCKCSSQEELDEAETYFIEFFDSDVKRNGYNVRDGGSKGRLSVETKQKISAKLIGVKLSPEHRAKISEGQKTKRVYPQRYSDEHRKNISLALTGRKIDPAVVERVRQKNTGKKRSGQALLNLRAGQLRRRLKENKS